MVVRREWLDVNHTPLENETGAEEIPMEASIGRLHWKSRMYLIRAHPSRRAGTKYLWRNIIMSTCINEKMNSLLDFIILSLPNTTKINEYAVYGRPYGTIFIHKNKEHIRNEKMHELYTQNANVNKTISEKSFIDALLEDLFYHKKENKRYSSNDYEQMINQLLKKPLLMVSAWKEITGIESKKKRILLGPFLIIKWNKFHERYKKQYKQIEDIVAFNSKSAYVIGIKESVRDYEKAREFANEKFSYFEAFIHVAMGLNDRYHVAIIRPDDYLSSQFIVLGEISGWNYSPPSWDKPSEAIDLSDAFFKSTCIKKLFALINTELNPLKAKIRLAAFWLGQAMRDTDRTNGFIKAMISIEILLTYQEKGMITPSIAYQISETVAFILGKSRQSRIEIESSMKKLYDKRSSIVHSGSADIRQKDYYSACTCSRNLIFALLRSKKYQVNNICELMAIIKEKKYS